MIELVDTLLNTSRIELGAFSVHLTKSDVCALIKNVANKVKPLITAKSLKFKEAYGRVPDILIDEQLFRIVINNLIVNAIQYTPPKGTVKVTCRRVNSDKVVYGKKINEDSFLIMISDTGYGLPKKQQDKLFTKFFRADNIKEKQPDGTGLGLYIVKSIIDTWGGSIWFSSVENKGTTFYLSVPLTGMKSREEI